MGYGGGCFDRTLDTLIIHYWREISSCRLATIYPQPHDFPMRDCNRSWAAIGQKSVVTTTTKQMCAWTGPAIFCFGFRPFFLSAAVWAVVAMLLWIPILSGYMSLATAFDPVSRHAHEFLFCYLAAVVAGFLLTAVPTGPGGCRSSAGHLLGLSYDFSGSLAQNEPVQATLNGLHWRQWDRYLKSSFGCGLAASRQERPFPQ